jgi:hypothetical protein
MVKASLDPLATQGFSVLSGLPSLRLEVCPAEVEDLPDAAVSAHHVNLLKALGPSLTALDYFFSTQVIIEEAVALLDLAQEGHLSNLTSIELIGANPNMQGVKEDYIAILARSCPLLQQVGKSVCHVVCIHVHAQGCSLSATVIRFDGVIHQTSAHCIPTDTWSCALTMMVMCSMEVGTCNAYCNGESGTHLLYCLLHQYRHPSSRRVTDALLACLCLHQAELRQMQLESLEAIRHLMVVPSLRKLHCDWVHGRTSTTGPTGLQIDWPHGKPPMSICFESLSPAQLAALPYQHLSSVRLDYLTVGSSEESSREEQASVMQAVLKGLVQKQVQVEVEGMAGMQVAIEEATHAPGGGLQALASFAAPPTLSAAAAAAAAAASQPPTSPAPAVAPAAMLAPEAETAGSQLLAQSREHTAPSARQRCPLVLQQPQRIFKLSSMQLEAGDVLGMAAAWGSELRTLELSHCSLTPEAWAAISADRFAQLRSLEIWYGESYTPQTTDVQLSVHLMALLMSWPHSRLLHVKVFSQLTAPHIRLGVAAVKAALAARGVPHITLEYYGGA